MKKKEYKNDDVISQTVRMKAAALNPQHPDHQIASEAFRKIEQHYNLPMISAAVKEIEQADKAADILLDFAKNSSLEDFANMTPVPGLILLAVMAKVDEETRKEAGKILNTRQSEIARNPRPGRRHTEKLNVLKYWSDWQINPSLYLTEADFIRDMQEKTGINRAETIRGWIKTPSLNRLDALA